MPCRCFTPLLIAAALFSVGCGTKSASPDARSLDQPNKERADGRLTVPPKPLTLKDLERFPRNSPEATVMRLLFFSQWGSAPNIVTTYDPLVSRELGTSSIVGSYAQQRGSLLRVVPRVVDVRTQGKEAFIAIELATTDAAPSRHSFVLRRQESEWRIVQDTLLEQALALYVQTISEPDPTRAKPTGQAVAKGLGVAKDYRDLYVNALARDAQARGRGSRTQRRSPR